MTRQRSNRELAAIHAKGQGPGHAPLRAPSDQGHCSGPYRLYKLPQGNRTIYFYSRGQPTRGTPTHIPEGFQESMGRNGLPMLRRVK